MAGSQQQHDPQANRNPTQLVPPKIDTRIEVQGPLPSSIPAIEIVPLVPGGVLFIVGLVTILSSGSSALNGPALIVLGFVLLVGGLGLVFGANDYSSSRDLIKASCDFARAQQKLPFTADETAEKPVHGVTRMYANGMAETVEGHLLGVIRVEPRNTDLMTASEKNIIATQLTAGIDQDIRDFDFKYFSTTREVDPATIAEQYESQADAQAFTDDEWIGVRELLRDISDWYRNKNAADWGTREWQHYFIVRVRPSDVDKISRQDRTKSQAERILDSISGAEAVEEGRRNRMQARLTTRLDLIQNRVISGVEGLKGEVIGPEAHALLLAEFWSGASHNINPDEFTSQAQVSVWPGVNEIADATTPADAAKAAPGGGEGTGRHPPTQRPGAVESDESIPSASEQPGAVGVPTDSAGSEPGSAGDPSVDSDSPRNSPARGTTDASDVFDDPEVAHNVGLMAWIRDGLFGRFWAADSYKRWRNGASEGIKRQGERLLKLGDHADRESTESHSEAEMANNDRNGETDWREESIAEESRSEPDTESTPAARDGHERPLPRNDRIRDILATDYDIRNGVVHIGDQICKTFWIADFPTQPGALFLEELFTVKNVDIDVCIHADSRNRKHTISELKHEIATIGAEVDERAENFDVSSTAIRDDSDAYKLMFKLLRDQNTSAQPWDVSGYVTVRAGTRRALDRAEQALSEGTTDEQSLSFDRQKRRALEDDCERVESIMEGSPAKLVTLSPSTRQGQLFESASPNGLDRYDRVSSRNRKTLTLGGTLGAMFPPVGLDLNEKGGIEEGRNLQTGESMIADPFDRGGAPHRLTVAKSGSGKTYSVGKRAMRWWAADPERTLIFCDTMGGFEGVTKLCNGSHIVVDGSKTINPLDIQASAADDAHDDIDAFRMKVDELTQFVSGILLAQGVNPGEYTSTIEELATKTYARAGIYPNQPETHARESPTMVDYIETGVELLEGEFELPEDAPRGGTQVGLDHERIAENRNEYIVDLLTKLSGFKQGGKYGGLVGQTEERIEPGAVTYLDLQQIEGSAGAEKSTMLHLMLGQVYQTIKNAPKKSMFVIDEAHYLLHSEQMLSWLQKAARHWRHYDACMWFCSQSPADFAPQTADGEGDEDKETITGQCSTIEFGLTPELKHDVGRRFGMNDLQINFVKSGAVSGSDNRGFSQFLQSYSDIPGWVRTQVSASAVEDAVIVYEKSKYGDFADYLYQTVGIRLPEQGHGRPQLEAGTGPTYGEDDPSSLPEGGSESASADESLDSAPGENGEEAPAATAQADGGSEQLHPSETGSETRSASSETLRGQLQAQVESDTGPEESERSVDEVKHLFNGDGSDGTRDQDDAAAQVDTPGAVNHEATDDPSQPGAQRTENDGERHQEGSVGSDATGSESEEESEPDESESANSDQADSGETDSADGQ